MIVVQTSTSASPRRNSSITFSSVPSAICPCATSTRALGHQRADALGGLVDRLDAVVQEEGLAAADELALDRLRHQVVVVVADVGLHGPAALGRRLDHRDVAQPGERHLERARDRRGGQRQHVDLQPQLAHQLLLLHAEALLLVHDQQPELLRAHVAREQPVRADEDVDLALAGSPASDSRTSFGERKRETISIGTGSRAGARRTCRSAAARAPWSARGTSPACRRRRP